MQLRTTAATVAELFDGSLQPANIDTGLAAPVQKQQAFNILSWTTEKVSSQMPFVSISSQEKST